MLNEWQSPEYELIDWSETHGRFLIVHSFVIHPFAQGKGYSKVLLSFWENEAKRKDYTGIRLDAFTGNPVSLRLYEKNHYICRGAVYFSSKQPPHNWYNCYEKTLTIVRVFYFFTFRNTKCAQPKLQYSYKYSVNVLIFVSYVARWLLSSKNPRSLSCSYPQSPTI